MRAEQAIQIQNDPGFVVLFVIITNLKKILRHTRTDSALERGARPRAFNQPGAEGPGRSPQVYPAKTASCFAQQCGSASVGAETVRSAGAVQDASSSKTFGARNGRTASRRTCRRPKPSRTAISVNDFTCPDFTTSTQADARLIAFRRFSRPTASICRLSAGSRVIPF